MSGFRVKYRVKVGGFLLIECMMTLLIVISMALTTSWYYSYTLHYTVESMIYTKALRKAQEIIDRAAVQGIFLEQEQEEDLTIVCTRKPWTPYNQDLFLSRLTLELITVEVYWKKVGEKRSSIQMNSVIAHT